jgi:hypothetical protein
VILACLSCHVIYTYFDDFANFGCHAQASQLFEPAQASSPHLIIMKPKDDVVDILSIDTEALLDSLFLSLARNSPASHPRASSDADSFEDWPEANDVTASVYVALSADALSSLTPMIDAPRGGRKSCFSDSSIRKMKKTRWRKVVLTDTPRKRSKKAKVDINRVLGAPAPRDGSLSIANFDKSKWEIMYPLFVAKGLIDPSMCVNRRNT